MWYPLIEIGYQTRHFPCGELNHVGEKAQRTLSIGKIVSFCAWTSLKISAWIVPRSFGTTFGPNLRFGCRDVHRHDDRCRTADGHRRGKIR